MYPHTLLQGMNIESVSQSEIMITLGNDICIIGTRSNTVSDYME